MKIIIAVRDRTSRIMTSGLILADSTINALKGFCDFCGRPAVEGSPAIDPRCFELIKIGEIEDNGRITDTKGVILATGSNCKDRLEELIASIPDDEREF